ncbi:MULTISPECIES: alpha/beta hydrolase [unclassified Rhizobacter]|uniref:alpha/beta hydrolase n=1 Tax=unclassified Rhizobacter TaxID=2640088 RepID=UPI0006FAD869|nr:MULTISPECIES: alpha/beta fold hydrolase [unclassified Rhizobacter]KQU78540.1 alpha/beta hydrolase [Rhizobacter sp. Root29]KQW11060.1 alpha/beta hydrolase [Rhizobacter sp. Root1238]KRB25406.1 alpha/beta hydrolase [Rhizobacter sp. Root16D2]
MNSKTVKVSTPGPAGALECALDRPEGESRGVAVICHPHPQQGGTMDNKVVQTLARAFLQLGYRTVRFNFRGVAASEGAWDEGQGEIDDALAVIAAHRDPALPLALAGFSFGGYVASQAAARLPEGAKVERLVLVGPSTQKQKVAPVPEETLVIHGESDDIVPLSATLDWARPQSLPVVVIPGVGHFFHGQLALLKNLVVRSWHR